MTSTSTVWLVLVVAFCAANLPFVNERLMALVPRQGPKSMGLRLMELVVFYLLAGGLGLALEKRSGQIAPQNWEFYAITAALFLTFAFPGFVFRYLFKHRG
jgi:ABC-type microcin C transport system permease subunit YejB